MAFQLVCCSYHPVALFVYSIAWNMFILCRTKIKTVLTLSELFVKVELYCKLTY